jgi:hypothetical protein
VNRPVPTADDRRMQSDVFSKKDSRRGAST